MQLYELLSDPHCTFSIVFDDPALEFRSAPLFMCIFVGEFWIVQITLRAPEHLGREFACDCGTMHSQLCGNLRLRVTRL